MRLSGGAFGPGPGHHGMRGLDRFHWFEAKAPSREFCARGSAEPPGLFMPANPQSWGVGSYHPTRETPSAGLLEALISGRSSDFQSEEINGKSNTIRTGASWRRVENGRERADQGARGVNAAPSCWPGPRRPASCRMSSCSASRAAAPSTGTRSRSRSGYPPPRRRRPTMRPASPRSTIGTPST